MYPGGYIPTTTYYEEYVPPHCRPCGNGQICCTNGGAYYLTQPPPVNLWIGGRIGGHKSHDGSHRGSRGGRR